MKFICATFIVLVAIQVIPNTEAFIIKTVSFQKGFGYPSPTIPSPEASSAAFTASKNALVQTVSNAVTEKINAITSLVNGLVQLKATAKQDLLRTAINASNGIVQSVNGILVAKPTVFTKTFTFGFKPIYTTAVIPTTTTVASGVTTTTSGQSSGYYKYRSRA